MVPGLVSTVEEQQQFLGIIDEEADKLTSLVEQLLDLSRLQSGTLRIDLTPRSFGDILKIAVIQLQTLTTRHQFRLQIPEALPQIRADAQRIAQVLVNLVGNAVKFSPSASTITVAALPIPHFLQVDVSDEGIGIPQSERENVFEAFQQLNQIDLLPQSGAGLGLAICKSIIEAHGGSIWVQEKSLGTRISFTIPILNAD